MMTRLLLLLGVLFALCSVAVCQTPEWTPVRTNVGELCPGLDFWSPTSGYILDFISGPGPLLLRTDDGAKTLVPALSGIKILVLVDIVTANSGAQAITGGVSLLNEPISVQTNNGGANWTASSTRVISSTFTNINVLPSGAAVFFGTWVYKAGRSSPSITYNGYAISSDNGNTYDFVSWPYDVAPVGGSFVGNSFVAIAGSAAPVVNDTDATTGISYSRLLNHHRPQRAADVPADETYRSYIAVSNNAGSTWTTVFSFEGTDNVTGVSLGSIQFVSNLVGFVTGANHTAAGSEAFVLGTTDGGQNWIPLLQVPGAVFTKIECVSQTNCYVIGGLSGGGPRGNAVVYQTTDAGKTFTQTIIPKVVAFVDISVVSPSVMYAAAVTSFQTCDIYYFGPPQ